MNYQHLCDRYNELVVVKYGQYISKIESNLTKNPREFWKFINGKRINKRISYGNILGVDSVTNCGLFADFFKSSYINYDNISDNFNTENIRSFDYLSNIDFTVSRVIMFLSQF